MPQRKKKSPSILASLLNLLEGVGSVSLKILQPFLWLVISIGDRTLTLIRFPIYVLIEIMKLCQLHSRSLKSHAQKEVLRYSLRFSLVWQRLPKYLGAIRQKTSRYLKKPAKRIKMAVVSRRPAKAWQLPSISRSALTFAGLGLTFAVLLLLATSYNFLIHLPDPKILAQQDFPVTTKIYDRNDVLLYQIYAQENRTPVKLADLPPYIAQATIAFEDKNFYHHQGLDFRGIVRAVFANVSGQPVQGGSTITQQLIKSALLTSERTWERKLREMFVSLWAERLYSKDQLLEMYLNQIPYGSTAYGIEAASETYFGKPAKKLTLPEAALVVSLPSAPSAHSPFGSHPEMAKEKQLQVLDSMVEQGDITTQQASKAAQEPLLYRPQLGEIKAPHFVMFVKDYLVNKYGIKTVEKGGLNVYTTLDYGVYEQTLKILAEGVKKQSYMRMTNGAAVVANPQTGQILSMVGSTDYFSDKNDGNVNVTLAERSPGSSIKPLTYALALESRTISPGTILVDAPVVYRIPGDKPYAPNNYDNRFHGPVTVRTALASSYNVPAVKVLEKLGVMNLILGGHAAGINSWKNPANYGLSLTLGGGEVTALEMTQLYSIFANSGTKVELNPIIKVTDYKNNLLEDNQIKSGVRVFSPETSYLISNILADNSARTPAFGPNSNLVVAGKTVSVKTGTTQEKRDNWTIGYTPSVVVAVWVGNNDNSPMSPYLESGNTGAAAIWNPIMNYLLKDKPAETFSSPTSLIAVSICTINGLRACDNCPSIRTEYFVKGTEPTVVCQFNPEDNSPLP